MRYSVPTQINNHGLFLPRAVLELVWVQELELGFPQHLLATRIPTTTMTIMLKTIMPTSMTIITIPQTTRMRRMTSVQTCSQESSSLPLMVTQTSHELQTQRSLLCSLWSCPVLFVLFELVTPCPHRIQSRGRIGRYWELGYIDSIRGFISETSSKIASQTT